MNRRVFLSLLPSIPLVPHLLGETSTRPMMRYWSHLDLTPINPYDYMPDPARLSDGGHHEVYCIGNRWHPIRLNYVTFDDKDSTH